MEQLILASGLRGPAAPPAPKLTGPDDEDQDQADAAGPEPAVGKRTRSTRRRQDAPDLPRRKVVARTVGKKYVGRDGKTYQPSTFLTFTLDTYGPVREDGSPVNPSTYDYRRAAWDAVHFPALLDRLWQNLRRAEGWNIQYFGSVEPQRRLARTPTSRYAARSPGR